MKSKLESLVAYLADRGGDDAEWVRHELSDSAGETSQFLTAIQELSRDAFAEHVLKWLGLPPTRALPHQGGEGREGGEGPATARRKTGATHMAVWVLPWFLSFAACVLAVLVWLDCRKHRHGLEAALEAAHAGMGAEAVEAPNELKKVDLLSQDGRPASMPATAPGTPTVALPQVEEGRVGAPDETKQPVTETKERAPTKAKGVEQQAIKGVNPPAEIPGKKAAVIAPDPSAPGREQVPESRASTPPLGQVGEGRVEERPEKVAVPRIQGLSYAEAKKRVEAAGLVLKTVRNSPAGLVKGQNPAAGAFVKRGEVVLVTLTPDPLPPPAMIPVPNVCGLTGAKNTEIQLQRAGLAFAAYRVVNGKRIVIPPQNYNQLEKFKVVKQRPLSGASVPAGTCVECIFEAP